jgi:tetratricopeptide (TPR) repeat protein
MRQPEPQTPSPPEVLHALERILSSAQFKNAAVQSALLSLVVEKALRDEELTEVDIGYAIFTYYNPESHKVRANASVVRSKLFDFYQTEGEQDVIRIDLPPGPSYRPKFRYHDSAKAIQLFQHGSKYHDDGRLSSLFTAINFYRRSLAEDTTFVSARVALSDAYLRVGLIRILTSRYPARHYRYFRTAGEEANTAIRQNPNSWGAYIVRAAILLISGYWKMAGRQFGLARTIDERRTESSLWYATYLMITGATDHAITAARSGARLAPESPTVRLAYAFQLYLTRNFDLAVEVLNEVWVREELIDLFFILGILICIETNNIDSTLTDILSSLEAERASVVKAGHEREPSGRKESEPYFGLDLMCMAMMGDGERAERLLWLKSLDAKSGPSIHRALGYLAIGKGEWAVAALRQTEQDGEIAFNWLHLLPIFDPIRSNPNFQEILQVIERRSGDSILHVVRRLTARGLMGWMEACDDEP